MFDFYSIFITKIKRSSQLIDKEGISKVLKMQERLFITYIRHSSTRLKRMVRSLEEPWMASSFMSWKSQKLLSKVARW